MFGNLETSFVLANAKIFPRKNQESRCSRSNPFSTLSERRTKPLVHGFLHFECKVCRIYLKIVLDHEIL